MKKFWIDIPFHLYYRGSDSSGYTVCGIWFKEFCFTRWWGGQHWGMGIQPGTPRRCHGIWSPPNYHRLEQFFSRILPMATEHTKTDLSESTCLEHSTTDAIIRFTWDLKSCAFICFHTDQIQTRSFNADFCDSLRSMGSVLISVKVNLFPPGRTIIDIPVSRISKAGSTSLRWIPEEKYTRNF